ncbi:MAG TPA: hypothetical protein VFF29_02050 [Bacteroidota bacterium]|nr:hypothetical protein [Bacteroidota bacterium]
MRKFLLCLIGVFFIFSEHIFAVDKAARTRDLSPSKTTVLWAKHFKQGYNMRVWLSNQLAMGIEAWDGSPPIEDCGTAGIGLEYPLGSCGEHLYGAGPWISGTIDGVRRATEGYNGDNANKYFLPERKDSLRDRFWITRANDILYDYNFDPPRLLSKPVNRRQCDDDDDGKIDEDELDGLDNDGDWDRTKHDLGADGLPDSLETGCLGAYDPVNNPDPAFDNYEPSKLDRCHPEPGGSFPRKNNRDRYTQNNGIPDHGEPNVDEDYAATSDQDVYCAATDTFTQPIYSQHFPMGIKVFQKSYAWSGKFAEGVLPIDYYFINVGRHIIKDAFVGFFADMDVGPVNISNYYQSNFAGYYTDLRTAYIHNALHRGSTPLGLTVLGTPRSLDDLRYTFQWHGFTEPGSIDSIIYSWMSCERFGYVDCIKPDQSPSSPTDTRFFFSFGPFDEIRPGDTLKISVALIGGDALEEGFNNLKENAQKALKLFKRGYVPPIIPPSPSLRITKGFKKATLEWGGSVGPSNPLEVWDDSNKIAGALPDTHWRRLNPPCGTPGECVVGHRCENGKLPGGRIFEGYRLYRSEDPGDSPNLESFTMIKQFDMKGDEFGYETGLDSFFIDSNLVRGKRYWYSVTSFGIPDIAIIEIPESAGIRRDTLYTESSESAILENATRVDLEFSASNKADEVLVVPNPYRVDQDYTFESGGWEGRAPNWTENQRRIKFIHMPRGEWIIRIFSLVGDLITTIENRPDGLFVSGQQASRTYNPELGEVEWDIISEGNRALASGIYVYTVESSFGKQIGKFVLIR